MAISIDTIYQRVLAIANKEQRGYLTPQEFNLLANQAQMEIFEQYFYDINQFSRVRQNNSEYSNMIDLINEKLDNFKVSANSLTFLDNAPGYATDFGSNLLTGDNSNFGASLGTWAIQNATQGSVAYGGGANLVILNLNAGGSGNITNVNNTVDTSSGSIFKIRATIDTTNLAAGQSARVIFNNVNSINIGPGNVQTIEFFATANEDTATISLRLNAAISGDGTNSVTFDDIQVFAATSSRVTITDGVVYRLGSIFFKDSNNRTIPVQQVSKKDFLDINSGPLTKPTLSNPVYVKMSNDSYSFYPASVASSATINFVRRPQAVSWAYNIVNEKALWNATDSTNFELHQSEETTLVNKILELAGILLQKPDLQAAGKDKVVTEIQQEKA